MNINCINNKIANANSALKPIILKAIREIYLNGNHQMTARMVKNQCIILDANILWEQKNPAICNSMRNSLECNGRIIGEDRDFLDFTISFDVNNRNPNKSKVDVNSKVIQVDTDVKNKKSNMLKNSRVADKKIEALVKSLKWNNIKDKKKNKLLIIACSDAKTQGGGDNNQPVYDFGVELNQLRLNRMEYYQNLNLEERYMLALDNGILLPAIQRYNGVFYSRPLRGLYIEKTESNNLHVLILSGLYGVLKFDDQIIDYNLGIATGVNWYQNHIHDAIITYINYYEIQNEMVFYSLSKKYKPALNPNENWNNIWITHDRGRISARFLKDYFLPQL